ncbi:hypothetical protein P171DRAFT_487209 [Karstenula rhodostoma CBS 690.94]|uniref:Uncharacterized protein n=1 Tax=Karstenula rhodostoma CBS 690.94 TaxID=1392251 RepID=A0A9P4UBF3_9PLEO|nr:hypothetical protein P171DRAFT_487209 [Karstenula rhodostoma CBS 690.94]
MNETFNWNHPGLDWCHFHSLANLLSLRNGGQVETSSLSDTVLVEDWSTDSGHGKLKRKFLDCLAEFAANEKGGTAVACSALKEAEDNFVIWVARNEGFLEVDKPVFAKLELMLGSLACGKVEQSKNMLWEGMLSCHQTRVENDYIPDLRVSLKAYEASLRSLASATANGSMLDTKYSGLRGLLFNAEVRDKNKLEWHTRLIIASYDLRRSSIVEQKLNSSRSATSKSRKLWASICRLARLRVAFENFKEIACTLPSFENVSIILIPRPPAPTSPTQSLDLKHTFSILGLELTPDTVKAITNQKWTLKKTEHEFRKRQRMKLNMYAEKKVEKKLVAPVEGNIRLERTSVLGGSSVFGVQREEGSDRRSQIDQLRMIAERNRVAEMFRRRSESAAIPPGPFPPTTEDDEYQTECAVLVAKATSVATHAKTKHYLWKSLGEDLIPEDEDVLQEFGFNNVMFDKDRTHLFGVYQGLYLSGEFSPKELHEWRVQGTMVEKIKEFYYSYPGHSRGQYFPWWLKNLHRLETPTTKEEAEQTLAATFYDKAKPYLDPEDRDTHPTALKPDAKRNSFAMLALILHRLTPSPNITLYHSFAFTTCRSRAEESQLLDICQLLLPYPPRHIRCILLVDSHGLNTLRSLLPHHCAFLSVPPSGPHTSVWDLKQFLETGDLVTHPPVPAVGCDYGFFNCAGFEDTCTLMEIYGRVLERADPMELHGACVAGRLFEFVGRFVEVEERWRGLLWNPYPLRGVVEVEEVEEEEEEEEGGDLRGVEGGKSNVMGKAETSEGRNQSQKGWCGVM